MKKSSLIIVLLFGILSLVYSQSITFQMPEITNPADTIAVPISVVQCNLGCCEIGTFQIIVEYDPAVLSPISVLFPNSNFPFYEWMINMVYEPNKIAITWLSFTGSGNIQPPEVTCEVLFAYFGGCSDLLLSGGGGNCTYIFENGSVGCSGTQSIIFQIPDVPDPGSNVFVPLNVVQCDPGCCYIFTGQFWLHYDPSVLNFEDIIFTNPNFPFYELSANYYNPCTWLITWLSFSGGYTIQPPEEIFTLQFTYYGGSTPLILNAQNPDTTSVCEWISISGCIGDTCQNEFWLGTVDNNWFEPDNWESGNIPTVTDNVIIRESTHSPEIDQGGVEIGTLVINSNSSLTIMPTGSLTLSRSLLSSGNLMIESDKIGRKGSFIDNGIYCGNGDFIFNLNLNTPFSWNNINSWHNISSPVNLFNTYDMLDYSIKLWDESLNEWEIVLTGDSCEPEIPPVLINPMEGWKVKFNQAFPDTCPDVGTGAIIEFIDPVYGLNTGSYSANFTANTSGYNLLGNPYPSYVDPSLINWPVNLNQAIYFKDGWSESYWSWVGGIGPNIPPAQGFFLKATGDGTLTFTGNERVHDSISNTDLPSGEKLLCLKVTNQEDQLFDLTYIRFKEESTPGFDQKWDAYKMFTESANVPQLYTRTADDDLSINTMPEISSVPLYFTCGKSGDFSIEAIETTNITEVYLEDLLTEEMTDLLEENYSFNYSSGENLERFVVHFNQTKINEYLNEEINIWLDKNVANIYLPNNVNGTLTVYDLVGHKIMGQNLQPGANSIQLDVPSGVYLTRIVTPNSSQANTIFIKN